MAANDAALADQTSFDDVMHRLDEIVETVRSKDTTLEASLDLLDEAIGLGMQAAELVDIDEENGAENALDEDVMFEVSEDPAPLDDMLSGSASSDGVDA